LNDLLEDFLSLGKLDEGKVTACCVEVNVKDLIAETVDEMNGLTKENQHIVNKHEGDEIAFTDNKLLKNILINLMTNAIKFSASGSTIKVNSHCNAENVMVSIADQVLVYPKTINHICFPAFSEEPMPPIFKVQGWGCILCSVILHYWVEM
jgi:K+-sensing histidine kinase KdpD